MHGVWLVKFWILVTSFWWITGVDGLGAGRFKTPCVTPKGVDNSWGIIAPGANGTRGKVLALGKLVNEVSGSWESNLS